VFLPRSGCERENWTTPGARFMGFLFSAAFGVCERQVGFEFG